MAEEKFNDNSYLKKKKGAQKKIEVTIDSDIEEELVKSLDQKASISAEKANAEKIRGRLSRSLDRGTARVQNGRAKNLAEVLRYYVEEFLQNNPTKVLSLTGPFGNALKYEFGFYELPAGSGRLNRVNVSLTDKQRLDFASQNSMACATQENPHCYIKERWGLYETWINEINAVLSNAPATEKNNIKQQIIQGFSALLALSECSNFKKKDMEERRTDTYQQVPGDIHNKAKLEEFLDITIGKAKTFTKRDFLIPTRSLNRVFSSLFFVSITEAQRQFGVSLKLFRGCVRDIEKSGNINVENLRATFVGTDKEGSQASDIFPKFIVSRSKGNDKLSRIMPPGNIQGPMMTLRTTYLKDEDIDSFLSESSSSDAGSLIIPVRNVNYDFDPPQASAAKKKATAKPPKSPLPDPSSESTDEKPKKPIKGKGRSRSGSSSD